MAELGERIPNVEHAISVSLPSWEANVGYEEGAQWVVEKMKCGYPRFFIPPLVSALADSLVKEHGHPEEKAILFPSRRIAEQCREFVEKKRDSESHEVTPQSHHGVLRILDLGPCDASLASGSDHLALSAVLLPQELFGIASSFWQHTGEGISSRRAQFLHQAFNKGYLVQTQSPQSQSFSQAHPSEEKDLVCKPNVEAASNAKATIRGRLIARSNSRVDPTKDLMEAKTLEQDDDGHGATKNDVFLYPTGMSAIYNAHKALMNAGKPFKSIMFGFPYTDTFKVLENFGPGCLFYGQGTSAELDDLEYRCKQGEKFLALFCEFPGNPLLRTPDLYRIKELARKFDFAVVVDETIGNQLNVHVLPSTDIVVCSLTKLFSGATDVMGGSAILNPKGPYYNTLSRTMHDNYEDTYWPDDAIVMEQNSRDFAARNQAINKNAQKLILRLKQSPLLKEIYYPEFNTTRPFYDAHRRDGGGYGGLFSVTFHSDAEASVFFNALDTAKGPSLGTNFTLSSPYVILAHYHELDWAARFGIEVSLVRTSVGMESCDELLASFERALGAIEQLRLHSESGH